MSSDSFEPLFNPRLADGPLSISHLIYRADDGTPITITVPWAQADIIPPMRIPFVDGITKRTTWFQYEASDG